MCSTTLLLEQKNRAFTCIISEQMHRMGAKALNHIRQWVRLVAELSLQAQCLP